MLENISAEPSYKSLSASTEFQGGEEGLIFSFIAYGSKEPIRYYKLEI